MSAVSVFFELQLSNLGFKNVRIYSWPDVL